MGAAVEWWSGGGDRAGDTAGAEAVKGRVEAARRECDVDDGGIVQSVCGGDEGRVSKDEVLDSGRRCAGCGSDEEDGGRRERAGAPGEWIRADGDDDVCGDA